MIQNLLGMLNSFQSKYLYWFDMPKFNRIDFVEIIIISFLVYSILAWIKNTRAWTLLKGIIVILVFWMIAAIFQMSTILWIMGSAMNVAIIAVVIIFQPELRRALESLGKKNFLSAIFSIDTQKNQKRFADRTINEIVRATFEMARVKTGALIVMEQNMMLTDFERTGIMLDSLVSSQLLINIFEHNTPLHDGAIIIRGDRIVSATCYLPLSDNMELSKELGTRHRAAVGVSEVTDALVIVVSEETGGVSAAVGGEIFRNLDAESLKRKLGFIQNQSIDTDRFKLWRRGRKRVQEDHKAADK
ncbi:MAG: TIGR00159 family protein [Lachnospiraceae bacterium]|nr:TIGR00159 family protein [Lachnospiraceae bacterium]MCI9149342.1 TIGR00159 family protein [Lachnospiraceae bacterium]